MFTLSCTFNALLLFILGSLGNILCILVFFRKKFRFRLITPYFVTLLFTDSIYLLFRLIKLLYYSGLLDKSHTNLTNVTNIMQFNTVCSTTFLLRIYNHATQDWPQLFIPFIHSETYMRFSLILMAIMSIQRSAFITRSLKFFVLPTTFKEIYKYRWTILIITSAFAVAYMFESASLTLFCSKSFNRQLAYDWFVYMNKYMGNSTTILLNTMIDRPKAYKCASYASLSLQQNQTIIFNQEAPCTETDLIDILSFSFDQHQRPSVSLIQKIILNQTGQHITKNEIRRKYQFHECLFPQKPNFFHQHYEFMYTRIIGINRHTLLLVFGSILPSLITIVSNIISVHRVRELNRLTSLYIMPCRRRTDDTRRILLVITVECLFAVVNSWLSDRVLSLVYCQGNLAVGDDCPMYLRQNYSLLIVFDLFNSMSNIILHCLCGRRFRNELCSVLKSFVEFLKYIFRDIWCCYFQIDCYRQAAEQLVTYGPNGSRHDSSNSSTHNYIHFQIERTPRITSKYCSDCRWYINRKPLSKVNQLNSTTLKDSSKQTRTNQTVRYTSLTQRTDLSRPVQTHSMRLYYPAQQASTSSISPKRTQSSSRH